MFSYDNISTEAFFKDNFEIDDYLSKCTQKSDLLTLRSDLKRYGQEMYGNMIDILKLETDNIVNLAENLTSLSTKIDDLAIPVAQLKEEIRGLYLAINDAELCFKQELDIAHIISAKRDLINLRIAILSSSEYIKTIIESWDTNQDITILERAVNEYSFQYIYSCELGIGKIINEEFVVNIASELIEVVHKVFLRAVISNNHDVILRCLRMYANLNKQKEAEQFVKEKIARPFLSKVFTQNQLEEHNKNMEALYDQALAFLNINLNGLLVTLDRNPDIKGFNFVIKSFWVEVDQQIRENLPNITAPGNPEFFQTRFLCTQHFLEQILAIAKNPALFKTDPSFDAHMKRFNLPVYFEIRFQQIAAAFETELVVEPLIFENSEIADNGIFMLKVSFTLWSCIQRCFHTEVFLKQLADQLFKLTMLLISRYIIWYEDVVKWPATLENPVCYRLEKFVMYSLMDIIILKDLVGYSSDNLNNLDQTVFKTVPLKMQHALLQILKINQESFDKLFMKLQESIVNFKIQQCVILLQQVSAIPRIYRRTNRGIPTEHSIYVIEAVLPLTNFYTAYKSRIHDKVISILDLIIAGVSERYVDLVQEVLKSVCKTEESLKRLKNRNPNVTEEASSQSRGDGISDETKIREQIKLDVGYFVQNVQKFSQSASKEFLKKLLEESGVNQS